MRVWLSNSICILIRTSRNGWRKRMTSLSGSADFWSTVAQHYASWDADRVFFEILNEPEMRDAYRWYGVEAKLAAAIRRGAPANTIIAAGARWDDDDDLVFLEAVA